MELLADVLRLFIILGIVRHAHVLGTGIFLLLIIDMMIAGLPSVILTALSLLVVTLGIIDVVHLCVTVGLDDDAGWVRMCYVSIALLIRKQVKLLVLAALPITMKLGAVLPRCRLSEILSMGAWLVLLSMICIARPGPGRMTLAAAFVVGSGDIAALQSESSIGVLLVAVVSELTEMKIEPLVMIGLGNDRVNYLLVVAVVKLRHRELSNVPTSVLSIGALLVAISSVMKPGEASLRSRAVRLFGVVILKDAVIVRPHFLGGAMLTKVLHVNRSELFEAAKVFRMLARMSANAVFWLLMLACLMTEIAVFVIGWLVMLTMAFVTGALFGVVLVGGVDVRLVMMVMVSKVLLTCDYVS